MKLRSVWHELTEPDAFIRGPLTAFIESKRQLREHERAQIRGLERKAQFKGSDGNLSQFSYRPEYWP